jgi:hypothetical protein
MVHSGRQGRIDRLAEPRRLWPSRLACTIFGHHLLLKIDDMRACTPGTRPSIALIAIVLACAGCRDLADAPAATPPELPLGAAALDIPADYAAWWSATEQCAGRVADLSRIRWFSVPGHTSFVYGDGQYDGYWWNGVHWILLAGDKVQDGMIVRHEMLHDLLGRGDHPPAYFQERCAGVVACNEVCRADD